MQTENSGAIISLFRRRTEEAVTGMTRNHFVGQPARGFESHRLRKIRAYHSAKTLINQCLKQQVISLLFVFL